MEAVIFMGIQGSGKSSFYRERFFNSHIRISLDLLKIRNRESRWMELCWQTQQRYVVDNTNPRAADRQRYILPAREAGFRVIGYYFEPEITEALRRNAMREDSEKIPVAGIFRTLKLLEKPTLEEGFEALFEVRLQAHLNFQVRPLPPA